MIGQTISHYKILEKLGEGGMGVVYKAHDTKLDRTIALKFLPAHASVNEETKSRFLQEARAAAALNHNNICTVYGIDESGGNMFIAMEYIEGGTLRAKLPYAKVEDAISAAIEIGEALQEAHSKGIVHRDIKADNVMLTSKGQVKVMDFGLAKLKGSLKITKASSTVGTLGYMAPEQIQGGEVDQRSDIFAFGVLLFEMLTGKLPFRGDHEAAIVYSIVNEEPESLATLRPEVSPEILHILSKALEKDPRDRYQSVNEMVVDLRRSRRDSSRVMKTRIVTGSSGNSSTVQTPTPPEAVQPKVASTTFSGKKLWLSLGAVVLVIAIVGLFVLRKGTLQLDPNMTFRTIQMPFTVFHYPGLSQDGNWIVFPAEDANGRWDLYWMHNAGGDARRVTFDSSIAPPQRWLSADISPDGSQIAYAREPSTGGIPEVCVVSSNGGIGRRVAESGVSVRWRPDGARIGFIMIASSQRRSIHSVKPDGTDERVEFVDSLGTRGNISFDWSPDGESVAWIRTFANTTAEVIIHKLQSGQEKQITFDGKNLDDLCWTRQNMIVFSSSKAGNTNLWCVPAAGGEEQQITKGSGPDLGMNVTADGRKLLYYQNQDIGNIWYSDGDGTNLRQITSDDQNITSVCVSPDGLKIVFSLASEQGFVSFQSHLFIMDRNGSNRRQLTFGDEVALLPRFSPDGKHVAYRSRRVSEPVDSLKINIIDISGSGTPKVLRPGVGAWWINDTELSVLYQGASWRVSLQGGTGTKMLEDSTYAFPIEGAKFTPFVDLRGGRRGLWVATGDDSHGPHRLAAEATVYYVMPQARFAYFVGSDRTIWKVYLPGGRREKIRGTLPGVSAALLMSFSQDGKDVVFINAQSRGKLVMIDNLFK